MSAFEFVLVLFAIIVGLAISEILASWADQLRVRHRLTPYPRQIALSAALLFFCLSYLWGLWTFREMAWSFSIYLLVAGPGLALSLAAHLVRVDTSSDALPGRAQYFATSGPIFSLLALIPVLLVTMSFVPTLRAQVPNPPNHLLITIVRVALFLGFASLAWSRNERLHWIGVGALFLVIFSLSARLTVRLITGAA